MKLENRDLIPLLSREYGHLGNIISVEPLQFSFHVNNQLFLIRTEDRKYILKFNQALNDFYGIEDATVKLEAIGRSTGVLRKSGMNVEETIPSINGNYVSLLNQGSLRLFHFIEGREYSVTEDKADLERLISFSKLLHSFPVSKLESEIPNIRIYLTAPYSLEETHKNKRFIQEKLEEEKGEQWRDVQENFETVFEEVERLILWNESHEKRITHVDLHPRNVIIGFDSVLSAIDLDYLRIGNPFVCLGLTFTRTTFFGKSERLAKDLENNLGFFESIYGADSKPDFAKNLLYGALYIEAEKIFRNLYRYYKTGMYRNFAEDVSKFHYQIFDIVRSIIKSKGY
ncbi:aminoglycoside phosphotransferase family protein [Leptospira barantonii]|uniref:Aminoglycoside phosphotransferase domain-containing protein n=1 Tax=Leptospira barantonii TaxID=2023184 RepID=A0ABX4NMT8_9LEPT|nr:aminoglycoside phosphotransferase family protein [Leptospira barantonii]PJZ58129.1 hypothetical protein CH367_07015 [Leptospira barantonii]